MTEQARNECACGRPAGDGAICRRCLDNLEHDLAEMPWLVTELDIAIAKQSRFVSSAGKVTMKGGHAPLIVNLDAADARAKLVSVLALWGKILGCRSPLVPDRAATYMLSQLERIRVHPSAAELVDEIGSARATALYVIDRPPERRYLGECGATYKTGVGEEEVTCTETLWGKHGDALVKCRACGAEWVLESRIERIKEQALTGLEDRVMTATQAAQTIVAYGIGREKNPVKLRDRIRKWATTPLLKSPMDLSTPGQRRRPGYRLGDVLELVERTDTLRGNRAESA
jgi:hypothetical protein